MGFEPAHSIETVWRYHGNPPRDEAQRRQTAAHRAGLAYEKKATAQLTTVFREVRGELLLGPWFSFIETGRSRARLCQPDALFVTEKTVTIFEIKVRHTERAWWQLRRLYEPVVRAFLPEKRIRLVEMTRSYDSGVAFPEPHDTVFTTKAFGYWFVEREPHELMLAWQWRPGT